MLKWIQDSFCFHTTTICFTWSAFLMEGLRLCLFLWSQEWNIISRSSTDQEIKENRESLEPFHLKRPLVTSNTASYHVYTVPLCPPQTHQMLFVGLLSCVLMSKCMSVLNRWKKEVRSCQTVMASTAVMFECVAWFFFFHCVACMHLFDGSGCFIINSSHIRFHGLSSCCSVGKF